MPTYQVSLYKEYHYTITVEAANSEAAEWAAEQEVEAGNVDEEATFVIQVDVEEISPSVEVKYQHHMQGEESK